jgi:hypothetical protein
MSEVVKIRISEETKIILQEIAKKEYRTFAEQCRLALDKWVNSVSKDNKNETKPS